jgi:hypothetical protein
MITLAQYGETVANKWYTAQIIDELRKSSVLLDNLEFDNTVGSTGGSSFPYMYTRMKTESTAAFRTVGEDYTPSDALTENVVTEVKILGGTYSIDRAIAKASKANFINQAELQSAQKVKAVIATFSDAMINGDKDVNAKEFDGLDKILTGSDTEFTSQVDLSTSELVDKNYTAFIDELDGVIAEMDAAPHFIAGNNKMITKIKAVARRAGQYQETKDDFGRTISHYGNAILLDLGAKPGSSNPIVGIEDGKTDLYFIRLGYDGFHGITLDGTMIDAVEPNFATEAATHAEGLVEMYGGVVLKKTKAAAVLRGIKIQ